MSAHRCGDEHQNVAAGGVADSPRYHTRVVDVLGGEEHVRGSVGQVVRVLERAVIIDGGTRAKAAAERDAYHLAARIDGKGFGQDVVVEGAEVLGLGAALDPAEGVGDEVALRVAWAWGIGEADHVAPLVD